MTWFHIPKRRIVLECVTNSDSAATYAPIARAGKFLPQWWADLAKTPKPSLIEAKLKQDMRACSGMVDTYSRGFMIPLWSALKVVVGEKGSGAYHYQYADEFSLAHVHAQYQRGSFLPDHDYQHLKLIAPWHIHCDEEVSFYSAQPTWNMATLADYSVLSGVLEFKYQNTVNINLMFNRKDTPNMVAIPLGQPLMHIMPLDKRPVEIKIVVDQNRYNKMISLNRALSFDYAYKNKKAIAKAQEGKCPFGFGKP
jgi:hypothetical protein